MDTETITNELKSVFQKAAEKVLGTALRAYAKFRQVSPVYGFNVDGLNVDAYRGLKSGARLCIMAPDADGDLCFLLLKEKKFHRDYVQWNLIEGMRNGPDLETDIDKVRDFAHDNYSFSQDVALSDLHTAIQEAQEEVGLNLEGMAVVPIKVELKTADGMQHGPMGNQGNFVFQDTTTYRVSLKQQPDINVPPAENSIKGCEWVKVKNCTATQHPENFQDAFSFVDGKGETHVVDAHQARSIIDSVRDHYLEALTEQRPDISIGQFNAIKDSAPEAIEDIPSWFDNAMNTPQGLVPQLAL